MKNYLILFIIYLAFAGCEKAYEPAVCSKTLYFPNSFTPNDDGLNDVFKPTIPEFIDSTGRQLTSFSMSIVSHTRQVFETDNIEEGWNGLNKNGHPFPSDIYKYYSSFAFSNGEECEVIGYIQLLNNE